MIVGRRQRWALHGVCAVLWVTAGLWWLLAEGRFAAAPAFLSGVGEVWRPRLLALHGLAAMFFLVVFGTFWQRHVWRALRLRANLTTGIAIAGSGMVLAATGWGLYYLGDERWRELFRRVHDALGWLLPAVVVLHVVLGRLWRLRQRLRPR